MITPFGKSERRAGSVGLITSEGRGVAATYFAPSVRPPRSSDWQDVRHERRIKLKARLDDMVCVLICRQFVKLRYESVPKDGRHSVCITDQVLYGVPEVRISLNAKAGVREGGESNVAHLQAQRTELRLGNHRRTRGHLAQDLLLQIRRDIRTEIDLREDDLNRMRL